MNTYKSFYKTVKGGEGNRCNYPTRLDLYGKGCEYNCCYCYARQMLNFRKLWYPTNVSVSNIFDVFKTINKIPKGSIVRLGGMTDCFQPIELKYRNTYNAIKKLNEKGIHYLIVTKSDLIKDPTYLDVMDKELAHIQVSIPSNNNKVLNNTDNAPNFEVRKNTVETLYENDFDVQVRLSPFFFDTVDFDIINDIKCNKVLVEFLRVKPSMVEPIKEYINFNDYQIKEGGYRHLTLPKKIEILNKLDFKELTVCDDVTEHYEYFKKNINSNPLDCCNLRIKGKGEMKNGG